MSDTAIALDPYSFPVFGSRLIEAGAGTGKTWTIAALYVRLVLGHGGDAAFARELDPPDILVVSFTEAATAELRDRIRRRLTEAATAFESPDSPADDFLATLRAAYPPEALPGRARRLRLAAEWMDEAPVSTIHAWCRRVLAEHAFDSGSPFTLTLEADGRELRQEAVRDWWRCHMVPLDAAAAAESRLWWPTPEAIANDLKDLLKHADALAPAESPAITIAAAQGERARRLTALKAPWPAWVAELRELLDSARAAKAIDGVKLKKNHYDGWLAALEAWASDESLVWPALTDSAWNRLSPAGLAEVWKNGLPPAHPALEAIAGLVEELAALPSALLDVLRHAARWVAARFDAEKRRRAEIGFDDLLARLEEALAGPNGERLAARIREKFPAALIDEFQDTDPVQYRIFDAVYRVARSEPDSVLVLIGDPKQAIYAFRGADIHTYLVARRDCAGRLYTLNRNFRSAAGMVAAVNRCFEHAECTAPEGAFLFRGASGNPVPFFPAEAQGRGEVFECHGVADAGLRVWTLPREDDARPAAKAGDLADMAAACASRIRALLAAGRDGSAGFRSSQGFAALRPEHIAVLVNDRTEAAAVRAALDVRGVRSVYLSANDSVFATAQAAEVQHWLEACAEPDSPRGVRTALATATLGRDWAALDALDRDEQAWEDCVLRFRGYRDVWRREGVLPMLRRLLGDHDVPARLLAAPGGERVLTDVLHLAELLQQASQTLDGEHALIRHLAVERDDAARGANDDTRQMRLESDADLVRVITVHKSKGLEYPLVFLPFGCAARPVDGKHLPLVWHDDAGRRHVSLESEPAARMRADRARRAEDVRKLYVALTRARHVTWVGVTPERSLADSAFAHLLGAPEAPLHERLTALRGGCEHIVVEPAPPPDAERLPPEQDGFETRAARMPAAHPREPWWIASYSALRTTGGTPDTPSEDVFREALAEAAVELVPARPAPGSVHAFPRGAAAGTFLHDLLEWAAREGFADIAADGPRLRAEVERRTAPRGWGEWVAPLTDWLQALMRTPLPLPGGAACALVEPRTLSPELEFWLSAGRVDTRALDRLVCQHTLDGAARPALEPAQLSGMLKGFIDLVFEHDGRYYVIDYKSNWLGPDDAAYTPQAMRAAVLDARYELQYVLYLFALHRQLRVRLPGYDYDRHVGGAAYVFLRGVHAESRGVHVERVPRELIEALDALFSAEAATAAAGDVA